ncbi:winged helix-turn-helix transcriptional regulator [Methanocorpusculum vombati]|uniref:Winged helix-turn-helix transcriptional regulator n=1 Tax=Methanocorpusculum vombati TaxID=3002864 RepID=A0ABT4IJN0_9EURY|nr:winged helix-turn-helix transcriptional regulator [Methanocorpusculum vombati]MCZ9320065.1 winged helix-turn-helix transcriptional regulator [Methanocorpusculum sp.]MCZ0861943.1 winged helix-turn-helix transcriptional regulator [Methanocorpusculum vombati]MDE2520204.1 winged helix-turn-helix transcriptional regulator [Methanocorpusculum sp.]MDE2534737.1 winged helix-turn-helix transcriptional regulator [Methanocorpusculum sp.]MDE2545926.1 winged helix-turn-helix transcriptional regulator [M
MEKELLREIGIVILVICVLFSAAAVLFFAEGGEIYGFNHDPTNPVISLDHPELVIEVVDEDIVPLYDDTEIKTVELWELPTKEILRQLIISPTAYIPPLTAHLITLFISALGLAFLVLYRRQDSWANRQENGRPEQIRTLLTEHPGRSLQQIADALGISHSTARHYLRRLKKDEQISLFDYHGHPHYFASGSKPYTDLEKLMYIILSRKKEERVITAIREHPGITKRELTKKLRLTLPTGNWHLQRLLDDGLLMIIFDGVHNKYQLTNEAADAYKKILTGLSSIVSEP